MSTLEKLLNWIRRHNRRHEMEEELFVAKQELEDSLRDLAEAKHRLEDGLTKNRNAQHKLIRIMEEDRNEASKSDGVLE